MQTRQSGDAAVRQRRGASAPRASRKPFRPGSCVCSLRYGSLREPVRNCPAWRGRGESFFGLKRLIPSSETAKASSASQFPATSILNRKTVTARRRHNGYVVSANAKIGLPQLSKRRRRRFPRRGTLPQLSVQWVLRPCSRFLEKTSGHYLLDNGPPHP